MILFSPRHDAPLRPRFHILGRPAPWTPEVANPARQALSFPDTGAPQVVTRALPWLRAPGKVAAQPWDVGRARSVQVPALLPKPLDGAPGRRSAAWSEGSGDGELPLPQSDLARRLSAALQPALEALLQPDGPLVWPFQLLPYQREGVAALLTRRELLLADDMGLGKTVQAVAALRVLFLRGEIETALVVCPASLLMQWRRELAIWGPELVTVVVAGAARERAALWRRPAHVRLVSYETLRGDVLDVRDSPALRISWSVVVLDEASRIKNGESGVARACKRLQRGRRWALTGTPLENRIEDIVSILEFLLGEPHRRASVPRTTAGIRAALGTHQLRRRKSDVLRDLPPKQIIEQLIEIAPGQRAAYDQAEQEGLVYLASVGASVSITHILELLARLKQICNRDPVSGQSAKIDDIERRLDALVAEGHRALIFSQFTDAQFGVRQLAERLARFAPITFTGDHSSHQKSEALDLFAAKDRHKALVLSLRAGGVGLNLQSASYVFHLDRWWNPALEEQAESRAHRMGQQYPVTVVRYVCANTIEERIDSTLRAKRALFTEVVDDVTCDLAMAMTETEIFGLFGLAPPRR